MSEALEKYIWEQNGVSDPALVGELARVFDIPTAAARFLASRSFTADTARVYLGLDDCRPHDPFLFDNMARAVGVPLRALGSDAHRPDQIALDFDAASAVAYELVPYVDE